MKILYLYWAKDSLLYNILNSCFYYRQLKWIYIWFPMLSLKLPNLKILRWCHSKNNTRKQYFNLFGKNKLGKSTADTWTDGLTLLPATQCFLISDFPLLFPSLKTCNDKILDIIIINDCRNVIRHFLSTNFKVHWGWSIVN